MFRIIKLLLIPSFVICYLSFVIFAVTPEDIKKFPPVSGEIFGQASPGVRGVTVNGKPVSFDSAQNFKAAVHLQPGEKYLVLKINYEGLRIIKKYLILRKSAIKKFKVFVPKEKIEKDVQKSTQARAAERRRALAKKKRARFLQAKRAAARRPAKPLPAKIGVLPPPRLKEYLYVWEFSEGKLLIARETKGKYSAEVYLPVSKEWLDLRGISAAELRQLIAKPIQSYQEKEK